MHVDLHVPANNALRSVLSEMWGITNTLIFSKEIMETTPIVEVSS